MDRSEAAHAGWNDARWGAGCALERPKVASIAGHLYRVHDVAGSVSDRWHEGIERRSSRDDGMSLPTWHFAARMDVDAIFYALRTVVITILVTLESLEEQNQVELFNGINDLHAISSTLVFSLVCTCVDMII